MTLAELAVIAGLVLAYSVVSGRLDRTPVTAPMVFALAGLVMGSSVLSVVDLDVSDATVGVLAEATLVLVLFSDAARIDVRSLRHNAALPLRLLAVGFPLTLAAGLLIALVVFPALSVWEAGLLAVILTPTDAALGQAVVTSRAVPVRIRQALNVESGLNDGLAVPVLAVMIAGAVAEAGDGGAGFWAGFIGEQLGYGIAIGVACGLIGGFVFNRMDRCEWLSHSYAQIAPLSLAVLAFAASSAIDGNGFLAAFVAGLAFGSCSDMVERVLEFAEEEGQLLAALTFFLFGAVIVGPAFDGLGWDTAAYAVLSLTIVRMVPTAISLIGSGMRRPTVGFLGWFGPRGLASIIFAIEVAEFGDEIAGGPIIASVVTCVVLMSIVAHGLTAAPASEAYGRWASKMDADANEMGNAAEMPTRMRQSDDDSA